MKQFSHINVCIWDVDGTLYPPSETMTREVLESAYKVIEESTGWNREKTIKEFEKVHGVLTPSSTEAVALICNIATSQAAIRTDEYFNRAQFLKRDTKLIALFEQLSGLRHFILGNGNKRNISKALTVLGIPLTTFDEIVTSETVGVNKPEDNGFRYILDKTGLPANEHLMIGDREKVDILPAKALGIQTCMVWAIKPSMVADITVPTVYELSQVLV
jgi:HAD superfamily hydrolase (TIGR01549 family)